MTSHAAHRWKTLCSRHVIHRVYIRRAIVKAFMVDQCHTHANETIMATECDASRGRITSPISQLMPKLEAIAQINDSLRGNDCFNRILTVKAVLPIY
jgi:hypothetical protein